MIRTSPEITKIILPAVTLSKVALHVALGYAGAQLASELQPHALLQPAHGHRTVDHVADGAEGECQDGCRATHGVDGLPVRKAFRELQHQCQPCVGFGWLAGLTLQEALRVSQYL
jgi:hypothetical protein